MRRKRELLVGAALGAAAAGGAVVVQRRRAAEAEPAARLAEAGRKKRVVILGAGFGGMRVAMGLSRPAYRKHLDVTVVDRQNYQLFTPILYHVASGLVDPAHIAYPVRTVARKHGFHFIERRIVGVDLARKRVLLEGMELEADAIVLALGSTTNYFGLEEQVEEHSLTLKSLPDGVAVRNQVLEAFERAEAEPDPEERRRWLTFVVVGAGATGVELIGALRGYIDLILLRDYPGVRRDEVRTILAEARGEILPGWDRGMAAVAVNHLQSKGIEVRLNTPIARITPESVETGAGDIIPCRTAVWTAGVKPSPLVTELPAQKSRDGRLIVDDTLRLPEYDGVFAMGDMAAWTPPASVKAEGEGKAPGQPQRPAPQLAQVAEQQGDWLGKNLPRLLAGLPAPPFRYHPHGQLVSLGRHDGLADLNGIRLTGFPAWVIWRTFYLGKLAGFRNKLGVATDWSFSYFYGREIARIDYREEEAEAYSSGGGARPGR
jgi:NADH:ubiquinone reductase (H+-translocating)